jgi:putative chitinase
VGFLFFGRINIYGDKKMTITLDILTSLFPKTKREQLEKFVDPLNKVCSHYEINSTPKRLAAFLAQIGHESGGFIWVKENLNYGAKGLRTTFGKYFPTDELAVQYERRPEKIANRVYANRMGNGPEESGDGFKFCGRGLIQLTGKDNYTRFANSINMSLDECVAYMETTEGACSSAGWFWDTNKLNAVCDKDDFIGLTKRINGGINGLEDRQHHYKQALALLQG